MSERSEMQKLLKLPARVKFGEREFEVKPIPLIYSLPWREKVVELYVSMPHFLKITTDDPVKFTEAMKAVMIDSPNKIIDLFFEYARYLKRDEVLAIADSNQLLEAWDKILEFEKPFLAGLIRTVNKIAA